MTASDHGVNRAAEITDSSGISRRTDSGEVLEKILDPVSAALFPARLAPPRCSNSELSRPPQRSPLMFGIHIASGLLLD
jgi:hypothetical protein